MIIEKVKGDLVELFRNGKTIAHGCNCFHAMASGVAGSLSKAFPGISEVDEDTTFGDYGKGGLYTKYKNKEHGNYCYNLYTQYNPGKDGRYGLIASAFETLNNVSKTFPSTFESGLYIPKIGAGIAGLEWNRVKAIIDAVTPNIPIILVEWDSSPKTLYNQSHNKPRQPIVGLDVMLLNE